MPKYVTNISTKHGTVISTTGDNQHVTITRVYTTGEEKMAPPPVPPTPASAPGEREGEDIITAIGRSAKVTINGKRVL